MGTNSLYVMEGFFGLILVVCGVISFAGFLTDSTPGILKLLCFLICILSFFCAFRVINHDLNLIDSKNCEVQKAGKLGCPNSSLDDSHSYSER